MAPLSTADTRPLGEFPVAQYWPGSADWPPPSPIGEQYWPGSERWPPPSPIGEQYRPWGEAVVSGQDVESVDLRGSSAESEPPASTQTVPTTAVTIVTAPGDVAAAVLGQVGVAEEAYSSAFRRPADPAQRDALVAATAAGSPAREALVGTFDELAGNRGYWTTPAADGDNVTVPFDGPVAMTADGTRATVWVCVVTGDTIFVDDPSGGPPEIIDSGWLAALQVQEFWLVPEGWRLGSFVELKATRGAKEC